MQEERTHIADSYARLFFTVVSNYTEDVVTAALEKSRSQSSSAHRSVTADDFTASESMGDVSSSIAGDSVRPSPLPVPSMGTPREIRAACAFTIPKQCSGRPRPVLSVGAPGSAALQRCLPKGRRAARMVTRAVSLVLQSMPNYSSWSKVFIASRLPLFIHVLGLPSRVVFHHFLPLLHGTQVPLVHALLIVATQFPTEIDQATSSALLGRLFMTIQDTTVEPAFRLLALNWFMTLSERLPSMKDMLFSAHSVREISPVWHDPLELKEMKLIALLYCFEKMETLPVNLLSVLDSISEYKYCVRPAGAHAVVFRFLLRVARTFPAYLDKGLDVPGCLCEMLAEHPTLLSSVLSVVRYTTSRSVKYVMLRELGRMVKKLEPPGRIRQYIGLLVILSRASWIGMDCEDVLASLSKLAFWLPLGADDWSDGMRIIAVCKQIMLHHEDARSYVSLQRLLRHMAGFSICVDLRDAAGRLLQLLMTLSPNLIQSAVVTDTTNYPFNKMSQKIVPLLPKQVICPDQPIPFIRFVKSLEERRKSGLLDGHGAVFLLPGKELQPDVDQKLWRDPSEDQRPLDPSILNIDRSGGASNYLQIVESQHCALRLPFVLQYVRRAGAVHFFFL